MRADKIAREAKRVGRVQTYLQVIEHIRVHEPPYSDSLWSPRYPAGPCIKTTKSMRPCWNSGHVHAVGRAPPGGLGCIVQSYLQWLQDSDYNPNCRLCLTPLSEKETTRLVCYASAVHSSETLTESSQSTALSYSSRSNAPSHSDYTMSLNNGGVRESHAVINMSGTAANESITIHAASSPRKMYDTRDTENSSVTQIDFDDDKYRRRSALNWFAQILKNRSSSRKRPRSMKQRVLMVLIIGIIGFFTLILIMSKLGRASTENDPNLDPLLNPNIRVGQE
ncbi:ZFPL1 protein, partial [Polypterus senegalus]